MALIHYQFFAESLGLCTSAYIALPQPPGPEIAKHGKKAAGPYKTMYLLHGLSDDHSIWLRRTSIERYADSAGIAVVMPEVGRSWYTDMARGLRYWTYVSEELPSLCQAVFPLSAERDDNYVAGLSMGGYGAFKLALGRPDRFAAGASLSGALDMASSARAEDGEWRRELQWVFGPLDQFAGSDNDLLHLASHVAHSAGPRPRLYQWCGTEDFLYVQNQRFREHATTLGLDLIYEEGPGGHTWDRWDAKIQRVIEWLGLPKPK